MGLIFFSGRETYILCKLGKTTLFDRLPLELIQHIMNCYGRRAFFFPEGSSEGGERMRRTGDFFYKLDGED